MKANNIIITAERDEEQQIHHLKILDKSTNEILCRGNPVHISQSPIVDFESIVFTISSDGKIWCSFDSIQNYVKPADEAQIETT